MPIYSQCFSKIFVYSIYSSLHTQLNKAVKEVSVEEKRILELKTNSNTLNENTDKVLSKLKQLELQMDKIQCDSTSKIDELSRFVEIYSNLIPS